jgi:hypothetical protein
LQKVGTQATGPRQNFATELRIMNTSAENETYGVTNMAAGKGLQFYICQSNVETETTTWSFTYLEWVATQREREIYGITSTDQQQFNNEPYIRLIDFEAGWETTRLQALMETIEHLVLHFDFPIMHPLRQISESIQ